MTYGTLVLYKMSEDHNNIRRGEELLMMIEEQGNKFRKLVQQDLINEPISGRFTLE
ncbi:hypothetical protein ACIQWQ_16370 [Peribacillus frigoritolerans]